MPLYKSIVLTLLQEQYPSLHEQLRRERKLLEALNQYATDLKTAHLAWMDELRRTSPEGDSSRLSSEAMELAIEYLQGTLPCESPPTGDPDETFSLDGAMTFIRSHTPPA